MHFPDFHPLKAEEFVFGRDFFPGERLDSTGLISVLRDWTETGNDAGVGILVSVPLPVPASGSAPAPCENGKNGKPEGLREDQFNSSRAMV